MLIGRCTSVTNGQAQLVYMSWHFVAKFATSSDRDFVALKAQPAVFHAMRRSALMKAGMRLIAACRPSTFRQELEPCATRATRIDSTITEEHLSSNQCE